MSTESASAFATDVVNGTNALKGVARAIAVARALRVEFHHRSADDIHVKRIIAKRGAIIRYGNPGCDGRILRSGEFVRICIHIALKGTPRARWTAAHELGHLLLHDGYDAFNRLHGTGPKTPQDYQADREADAFAAELLMPDVLFAARCGHARPTIETIADLAAEFGTSITATGKRYAHFATAACAFVECKIDPERGMVISQAARSKAFRGVAVWRRVLETETVAARLLRGEATAAGVERVTNGTWGSARLDAEMTEHAILVVESGGVIAWLWHG